MHILVAAKQVLDPDGVNSYALWGRLAVDESGRGFNVGELVPRIINAYDEQAMEAALRLKDAQPETRITAVSVGPESTAEVLKRCVAMGADGAIQVLDDGGESANGLRTAAVLAGLVRELGDVDLVLCGRQGSDYDQGTVPGALAEMLGVPLVTLGAGVEWAGNAVRVTRATPLGNEVVEADLPAVVTISNELGTPRYPTSRGMLDARRKRPEVRQGPDLAGSFASGVELVELFVPEVQGRCEMIEGGSAAEKAEALLRRLRAEGVLSG
jgi:electron transfer flavoprotein beta subunit